MIYLQNNKRGYCNNLNKNLNRCVYIIPYIWLKGDIAVNYERLFGMKIGVNYYVEIYVIDQYYGMIFRVVINKGTNH